MKYCYNCGTELPDEAKFCTKCGTAVQVTGASEQRQQNGPATNASSEGQQQPPMPPNYPQQPMQPGYPQQPMQPTQTEPGYSPDQDMVEYDDYESGSKSKIVWIIVAIVIFIAGLGFAYWKFLYSPKHQVAAIADSDTLVEDTVADTIVAFEDVEEPAASYGNERSDRSMYVNHMGFHQGVNKLNGEMIHTNGQRFPFKLQFTYNPDTDTYSNIVYVNVRYGTKLRLQLGEYDYQLISFVGNDGSKDFIIRFSGDNPYWGDAWWGDFHQDVELKLQ